MILVKYTYYIIIIINNNLVARARINSFIDRKFRCVRAGGVSSLSLLCLIVRLIKYPFFI